MLGTCLQNVREKGPLVHNITNYVTVNDVANVILACGASPIMSDEPQDGTDTMADAAEGGDKAGAGSDLTAALAEWQDKFIRLQAEFDNYRKRTLKEKMDLVQTGGRDVLLAMLPVRDDVQRAVDAMQKSDDIEALRIGMYNKVQEGPTYYSYIAFDLFGGELMTSTGRPIDLINSLSNALHTFVSSQWNGYYKALLQVNNVMSIAEGLADSPTRNRVLGECRYFRAYIYLCLVTRFGDVPVLCRRAVGRGVSTVSPGVENFVRIVCTMSYHQRIRLIGLIVGDNVQRKAGFSNAIINDALFDITFHTFT